MFKDRKEAGFLLSKKLKNRVKNLPSLIKRGIILGIPRGGVVVAKELTQQLKLPLDIVVIRKIGLPNNPELAIGAVGPSPTVLPKALRAGPKNTVYWDNSLLTRLGVDRIQKEELFKLKSEEQAEKEKALRLNRKKLDVKGKIAILVDDGVATGATVLCAWKFLKKEKAKKIILAVPVIAKETYDKIKENFDEIITLSIEDNFYAVGQFYQEFPQVEDEEVVKILRNKN